MAKLNQICFFFQIVLFATSTPIPIKEKNSDQGLYNKRFFQGDIYMRDSKEFSSKIFENYVWPNGVIVYRLDEKIGCPDSEQCQMLMTAFNHYHKHSCIRFQEWTGEKDYVHIFLNPVPNNCWSAIGKSGGQQELSLSKECWHRGIVVHELGHVVGFWHEMSRPDRDDYIKIIWDNIPKDVSRNFEKQQLPIFDKFDYRSIMMYDEFAFSKDQNLQTIEVKEPNTVIGPIWGKSGLSASDKLRIERIYACKRNETLGGLPYDTICTFDNHTCGFKSAGQSKWEWSEQRSYVYTSFDGQLNTTGFFVSVNFHANPKGHSEGCVRFSNFIRGDGNAYLKLRQSFLSSTTQLEFVPQDTYDLWESDNVTNTWEDQRVLLNLASPFKLIFEASPGNTDDGLVALDNFKLSFSPCS